MNLEPIYEAAALANGFAPMPAPCPRCTQVGASGLLCDPCAGEIAARLRDPDDELVSVRITGHGRAHHGWLNPDRPDVRVLPLTGPQSPGVAW